ncbi:MAG: 3,4-dihydroxy-2-butanone-4-phosphate synthase [Neomegalonema sp.]|nr:3,4-dihydroxy-2-butanone-4-phosphate synthase [Neomegalonema sp.]
MTLRLDPIELAIQEIAAGRPVVVVDDEDRENEGDLIMAAELATPEHVAFIVRHTSGILCTPIERVEAQRLGLAPMVSENDAPLATAFTVSVDYRHGLTTGISAEERCHTVRALANPNAGRTDFVRPGHIFPLIARDGGVLIRTGHTEAAVDLARLAGLRPVGLIAELVNDDGSVKKGREVEEFAQQHQLALVSIDDLIAYRQQREKLIKRIDERTVETLVGPARAVVYSSVYDDAQHVALMFGNPASRPDPLVRLHQEDVMQDVFGGPDQTLWTALRRIREHGDGVFVYLRHGAEGVVGPFGTSQIAAGEGVESDTARRSHWRDIGLGAQIIADLGLDQIRVLSTRERQYVGLHGFGIEILGTELL